MIRFNFIVDEQDADTIMRAMQASVQQCDEKIVDLYGISEKQSEVDWLKSHKKYLLDLMSRMKNERINDETGTNNQIDK